MERAAVFVAVLTLSLSWAAAPATAEKVRRLDIVDRSIEHHGGDLYTSSVTSLTIRSRSGEFRVVSRVFGESFEHVVTAVGDEEGTRKVRYDNASVQEWRGGEWVDLEGEDRRRARDFVDARIYFPFLPYRLNDPSVWKEDQGLEVWDGQTLRRVRITFDPGSSTAARDEYLFWFDPESARLVQYAYSFGTGQERGGLRLRRLFNHRRVSGILFSDAQNLGVDGSGELRVDRITPDLVATFEPVSTVLLRDIEVRLLR